jgi:hypothetical protein
MNLHLSFFASCNTSKGSRICLRWSSLCCTSRHSNEVWLEDHPKMPPRSSRSPSARMAEWLIR